MGKRAIELRNYIVVFYNHNKDVKIEKRLVKDNYLIIEDWRNIAETVEILKSFYN